MGSLDIVKEYCRRSMLMFVLVCQLAGLFDESLQYAVYKTLATGVTGGLG